MALVEKYADSAFNDRLHQKIVEAVEALVLERDQLKQELEETIETYELGYRGFP
jgi:hypothetical protein